MAMRDTAIVAYSEVKTVQKSDRDVWEFTRPRQPDLATVARYDVPDVPPGLQRHIVCSLDVPAASIGRLNLAIRNAARPALQTK